VRQLGDPVSRGQQGTAGALCHGKGQHRSREVPGTVSLIFFSARKLS